MTKFDTNSQFHTSASASVMIPKTTQRSRNNSGGLKAPRRANGNIDWQKVYDDYVGNIVASQKAPNTNRGIMYILLAKHILKKSDYDGLTGHLVQWRKDGLIDWNDIADGSGRGVYKEYQDFTDLRDAIDNAVNGIGRCGENYRYWLERDWRWYYQPHYVEFWSEKHAVVGTIAKHIEDYYVRVAFNRGNPGWGYMHENCERLKEWLYYYDIRIGEFKRRKIHIWYLGDSDNYGRDMDRQIREQLAYFGLLDQIEFKRIAVLPSQVREYGLIESFDKDRGYEIDALNAFNPSLFSQLLHNHTEPYFDHSVHQLVLKKFKADDINNSARARLDDDYPVG
jgi:hypothetical protein